MTSDPVRVAFDATACLGARTGIGRFTLESLRGLRSIGDLDVCVFAVSWRGRHELSAIVPEGMRVVSRPMAARPLHEAWLRRDVPKIEWWTGKVDVVHGPNYVVPPTRRAARVVTVHDLTPLRFPELADAHTRTFPRMIERAIHAGAWVHTSSAFVAAEVVDAFGVDPDRVVVIPGAVTPLEAIDAHNDGAAGRELVGSDRYVLALGTVEPRKDLPALVSAFDVLASRDQEVCLAIAGAPGWGADALDAAIAGARHKERIRRFGRVDETRRAALLRGASVLGYPSRYEGFGLPPLEAMDAQVPVVCTDAGSLPEVVGDAGVFVSAHELEHDRDAGIHALADALASVLDDQTLRRRLIEAGGQRVRALSWQDTAERFARLYRRAASAR